MDLLDLEWGAAAVIAASVVLVVLIAWGGRKSPSKDEGERPEDRSGD